MSVMTDAPLATCPVPANEALRLQATRDYEILDTGPDLRFDAIARVAAALFEVPVVLIALMDADRLWFKSRLGLDLPQLDRSIAFCAHAITSPRDLMVVDDLSADPRFADHPLVAAGPRVRFYASAPLLADGDLAVGTIALLDVKPRTLGAVHRAALADLSTAVMTALEAHKHGIARAPLARTDHLAGAANRRAFPSVGEVRIQPSVPVLRAGDAPARQQDEDRCGACADGIAAPFPFTMAFQPIVDVKARTVFAYEALVRGPGGEGAMSVLEKVTVGNRYAFDQSCRITAIRLAAELGVPQSDAYLSINFIPGAMYEPRNCIRATLAAARRYDFRLDRLIFEVTEGEEVTDKEKLREIFDEYHRQGFLTAIDDFGAGYSGLNLLKDFQPHLIKLDMEMIRNIHQAPAQQAIVHAVIAMCRDMRIRLIAEGVETLEEYRYLHELGIRLYQGYLFARPAFEALPTVAWP
jgi:EAL domain-containing protein (putative c-di-GMP-specific phosphodiesterase class I)